MIQGTWQNRLNAITIEKPNSGIFVENDFVDIGGFAVDSITAKEWVKNGMVAAENIKPPIK